MTRSLFSLLTALAFSFPAAAATPVNHPPSLTTSQGWHGSVSLGSRQVPVGLDLSAGRARLWLPDQGVRGVAIPIHGDLGGEFSLQLTSWPGQPRLQLTADGEGQLLRGTFQQGSVKTPITLWPGAVTLPPRPQEPRGPVPYRSQEVTIWGANATALRGTLTLPAGDGPFPAALLISGSGPQDRDSTLHGHRPFLVLADQLTRRGIAVLRLDDRGIGASGGDLYSTHYRELTRDLAAAVSFLRQHRSIRRDQVGLIGHSEGGSLALLAAEAVSPAPAFLVLLGSPSVPGRELLDLQLRAQLRAQGLGTSEIEARSILQAQSLDNHRVSRFQTPLPSSEIEQAWLYSRAFAQSPYLQDFLAYDPQPALEANRVPTLAIFGSRDLQVPHAAGAGAMASLLHQPGQEVHELQGLNHLLQPAQTGLPREYAQISTTLDPKVLNLMNRWLRQNLPD